MNIRSPEVKLSLVLAGLLTTTACTAEKTTPRNEEMSALPAAPTKTVDGIYASNEHLQPVYFDLNQTKLTEPSVDVLKANMEWLKSQPPYLVRIIGYADSRGSSMKNNRVAERRAISVRDAYLALGIPKDRISIVGKGAEDPACQPLTEECLSKSRRTETFIEDKDTAKAN